MAAKVWTVGDLLSWTEQFLAGKGSGSPRLDAQVLLAHALQCQRPQLYTRFTEPVDEPARTTFRELVKQRGDGCPVAYLTGRKEFFLLPLSVSPAVLIPRPATETLVTLALDRLKGKPAPRVLDVGTGSGCVALAVAKHVPAAVVVAVDVSPDALAVAQGNAERLGLAARITWAASDLLAAVPGDEPFDVIASNPPYIRTDDLATLAPDVRDHEPRLALDGGPDGFAVIDRLLDQARTRLAVGGTLLVEIGHDQGPLMRERAAAYPEYAVGDVVKDGDGLPRVAVIERRA